MSHNSRTRRLVLEKLEDRLALDSSLGLSPQAMVTGLYRQILQRDPDAGGLASHVQAVEAGRTASQIADSLFTSPEFRSGQVGSYYQTLLDRDAEPAGKKGWTNQLLSGASEEAVMAGIAGSQEYFSQCGRDNSTYVRSLYVRLLGREADAAGLQGHVNSLNSGTAPLAVASAFTGSPEFRLLKIKVIYRVALNREAEGPGAQGWTANWNSLGGLHGVTASILGSQENLGRLAQSGSVPLPDLAQAANLRRILQSPYSEGPEGFVAQYNLLLDTVPLEVDGDPVFSPPHNTALWNLTQTGGLTDTLPDDEKHAFVNSFVPVSQLLPTQNEVDFDKSLKFPLQNLPDLRKNLNGGDITHVKGIIMTGNGGRYILDGHHRWSSIISINPNARIEATDLGFEKNPQDLLKKMQIAVGAEMGFLPQQFVEGQNLFTMSQSDFYTKVENTINAGADPAAIMAEFNSQRGLATMTAVQDFLWGNVQQLRQNNQPVPGATSRGFMPQPLNNDYTAIRRMITVGEANFRSPTIPRLG